MQWVKIIRNSYINRWIFSMNLYLCTWNIRETNISVISVCNLGNAMRDMLRFNKERYLTSPLVLATHNKNQIASLRDVRLYALSQFPRNE